VRSRINPIIRAVVTEIVGSVHFRTDNGAEHEQGIGPDARQPYRCHALSAEVHEMKKKVAISLVLFGVLASPASAQQLKPVMKIVVQPSAPVTISSYEANYESRSSQYFTRGIHHNLKYQNTGP
jgi:hypothetical protein